MITTWQHFFVTPGSNCNSKYLAKIMLTTIKLFLGFKKKRNFFTYRQWLTVSLSRALDVGWHGNYFKPKNHTLVAMCPQCPNQQADLSGLCLHSIKTRRPNKKNL